MQNSLDYDQNWRATKLVELSRLSAQLTRQDLLQTIAEYGSELTAAEACSILLYDPSVGILRFVAGPWYQIEALRSVQVPLEGSIAGRVIRLGEPSLINHPDENEEIFRQVDDSLQNKTHSIAAVPVVYCGKVLGVIEAINKCDDALFTIDDLSTLEALAAQAAIALETMRLESEGRKLLQELKDLDQRKRDFVAITSHELRTPLGLILGNATFLKSVLGNHPYLEQVNTIIESAVRLKTTIEALSKVDHAQTGQLRLRDRQFDLVELASRIAIDFQAPTRSKNIEFAASLPDIPVLMHGDPEKITIILHNLLSNAVEFTPERGKIRLSIVIFDGFVQLQVKDTGPGIPKSFQERIFERFFQVEAHMTRQHGGMGLGLSIAKDLVEMHNGRIWVESEEGAGSTFFVEFPYTPAS